MFIQNRQKHSRANLNKVYSSIGIVRSYQFIMKVAIIGTGSYARALGSRVLNAGLDLVYGKRGLSEGNPIMLDGAPVLTPCLAAKGANIIVLAIPMFGQPEVAKHIHQVIQNRGAVVIDVSNKGKVSYQRKRQIDDGDIEKGLLDDNFCYKNKPCSETRTSNPFSINLNVATEDELYEMSHAEYLQTILTGVHVVKAFNTVSAYSLSSRPGTMPEDRVLVCGDNDDAKELVYKFIHAIGMRPVNAGNLRNARDIEGRPHELFKEWRTAAVVSIVLFVMCYIYITIRDIVFGTEHWSNVFLLKFNLASGWHALALMVVTFLAGSIAALKQLVSGTAKDPFPDWLDSWLRARKALGVFGLASIGMHLVAASLTDNLFVDWQFLYTINGIYYQISMVLAILATAVYCCLGISSIPSVGAGLSWREWAFIQSKLGIVGLFLGTLHCIFVALSINDHKKSIWPKGIPPPSFFVAIPAVLVLVFRFLTSFPPLSTRLNRIRGIQ